MCASAASATRTHAQAGTHRRVVEQLPGNEIRALVGHGASRGTGERGHPPAQRERTRGAIPAPAPHTASAETCEGRGGFRNFLFFEPTRHSRSQWGMLSKRAGLGGAGAAKPTMRLRLPGRKWEFRSKEERRIDELGGRVQEPGFRNGFAGRARRSRLQRALPATPCRSNRRHRRQPWVSVRAKG